MSGTEHGPLRGEQQAAAPGVADPAATDGATADAATSDAATSDAGAGTAAPEAAASGPTASGAPQPGLAVGLARVVTRQRRTVILAVVLAAAGLWILVTFGRWQAGLLLAAGIGLGLANTLATELTLQRSVDRGRLPSRKQYAAGALYRLLAVAAAAAALAVAFWPTGAVALFGLALFHLLTLLLTGIPLLKELRKA